MSWARLAGYETLVSAFGQAVQRGRLAHAYLFAGPKGVGKKRFAIELAKALLCDERADAAVAGPTLTLSSCDHCPACIQVEAGTHPDFQLVGMPEDKHEFPVDLMQEVIRNLSMKPARGRHRVAILDDADDFNEQTANCFLKTLEEPPPASLLILLGTTPDRQLPTVLSRCQIIRFPRLTVETVAAHLLRDGVVENTEAARRLATLAGGDPQEAAALADPAVSSFRRNLLDDLCRPKLDSVALAERVNRFVEEAGKESAPKRQRAGLILKFVIELLRAAMLLQSGGPPILADPANLQITERLAARLEPEQLLRLLERCLEADYQVDRRLQLSLVIEALMDEIGQAL